MNYPRMALVKQMFDQTRVENIPATVAAELDRIDIRSKVKPGQKIAITAGSRGVANIAAITKAIVDFMKSCKAEPFVFPAMGSHGGGTAEGQKEILAHYGITETSMGCPILATMEVTEIGKSPDDLPIFLDNHARTADHIVVVNRVKAHTKFKAPIESGLMKMMAIGMGKHHGAAIYHQVSTRLGMRRVIESVGLVVIEKSPILCGVATVENGYDETAIIRATSPENLVEEEKALLVEAKNRMARIPFSEIDLLIIDLMGKNISGTGMDTNVTGVNADLFEHFDTQPRTKRLFVRDLTPETEGNAVGIGLADFTTTRLVGKIDRNKTYINCITGISPEKAAIPMYFDTDRECIDAALHTIGVENTADAKIVHLRDTLTLNRINLSSAYARQIEENKELEILEAWKPLGFGEDGNLTPVF